MNNLRPKRTESNWRKSINKWDRHLVILFKIIKVHGLVMDKIYKMELLLLNNNKNFYKLKKENNKKFNKPNFNKKTLSLIIFSTGNNFMIIKASLTLTLLLILNLIIQLILFLKNKFKPGLVVKRQDINVWDFSQRWVIFYLLVIHKVKFICLMLWKTERVHIHILVIQKLFEIFSLLMMENTF